MNFPNSWLSRGKSRGWATAALLVGFVVLLAMTQRDQRRAAEAAADVRARQSVRATYEAERGALDSAVVSESEAVEAASGRVEAAREAVETVEPYPVELPPISIPEYQRLGTENARLRAALAAAQELNTALEARDAARVRELAAMRTALDAALAREVQLELDLSKAERAVLRAPGARKRARWVGRLEAAALAVVAYKATQ